MAETENDAPIKRRQNRYRLVVMNDDTYEEVITFKLSRLSVYVGMSSIFILLIGLTVALLVLTPLKYYIPGSNTDYKSAIELRQLKYRVDEAEKQNLYKAQYIDGLKNALGGNNVLKLDTTKISLPKDDISND